VQSGFHEAAGLKRHSRPNRGLKAALAYTPHPTIGLFAGSNLGGEPSAGGPGGPPKAEAQGIPKQLAAFSGAGGRQIGRANANVLAAEGDASEDYDAGGVIGIGGNPYPGTAGRGLVAKPVGEGGDLGGGVEALEQFGCGMGWRRTSGAADEQAPGGKPC
jgi:hypothetical protein